MTDLIKWFTAQFPGRCEACGTPFQEGESIGYLDNEIVGYDCCRDLEVCNKCFLVHSTNQGECE